jgi:glycosyltransferase involved in cell wall biosynthesis
MRLGCPVVAARAASLPEVCGDAVFYADPHRPAELAAQVMRASEPAVRAQLQAAGRQQAAGFTWASAALALWQLIAGCLKEK